MAQLLLGLTLISEYKKYLEEVAKKTGQTLTIYPKQIKSILEFQCKVSKSFTPSSLFQQESQQDVPTLKEYLNTVASNSMKNQALCAYKWVSTILKNEVLR